MKVQYRGQQFAARRRIYRLKKDLFVFENDVEINDSLVVPHVSGPTTILSHFLVESGEGTIEYAGHGFPMEHNSVVYLPKNAFVLLKARRLRTKIINYCSVNELCDSKSPFFFVAEGFTPLRDLAEIRAFGKSRPRETASEAGISAASLELKKFIDTTYREERRLSEFKPSAKLSRGTLTYHFKKDFGITPKEYLNRSRVIASMYDLVSGKSIVDSAFESGFSDLSRYYKNFRKFSHVSPGNYHNKSE